MGRTKTAVIEEYEINPFTFAILPLEYGSKVHSLILEYEDEIQSPFKPLELIKESCRFFGSSYEGRREGSKKLIGITHKAPITIDSTNSMFFFPTTSPSSSECAWISHEQVEGFFRHESNKTLVVFRNKKSTVLSISYHSFRNQMYRTSSLRTTLMQRKEAYSRKKLLFYHDYSKASENPIVYRENE